MPAIARMAGSPFRYTPSMRSLPLLLLGLFVASSAFAADPNAKKRAIESNLGTPIIIEGVKGKSLEERMRELHIPAVSLAVVDDGRVVLAAAYGQADVASGRRATTSTLFQAASISKPVTAMAVVDLVARGKLSLDVPVNTLLTSWQLPANALTTVTPVTVRQLLSHSGGTTVHGFAGYARSATRPALPQILSGVPPANNDPVLVDLAPNTKYVYSGGGTTIVQAVVVDQTGMPFPAFMRKTVLEPLGMTTSTYEQPLPRSRASEAATGYRENGSEVEEKWHVYPEMAAAGLWTTPTDLARVLIEVQDARAGRTSRVLSADAAGLMLTPRFPAEDEASIGIGFFIDRHQQSRYFAHGGANEGFRALFIGSMDQRKGAIVMTNSDAGIQLANEILSAVAREYAWPDYNAAPLAAATPDEAAATRWPGRYVLQNKNVVTIRRTAGGYELLDPIEGWLALYPVADGSLARADRDIRYAWTDGGVDVIGNASDAKTASRASATRVAADAPPFASELLTEGKTEEALAAYREQFKSDPQSLDEAMVNRSGYAFLGAGHVGQAVALMQLNTELHPTSANAWDSFGESLAAAGEKERAIRAYEEALRLVEADPNPTSDVNRSLHDNAIARLKALRKN
ncbi:MAG: serine hydrolase [Acidobacteriota bacterium]